MADMNGTAQAAHLSDAMQNGFHSAMLRAEEYDKRGASTLVDEMAAHGWADWNASDEQALVIDCDGLNGFSDSDTPLLQAA